MKKIFALIAAAVILCSASFAQQTSPKPHATVDSTTHKKVIIKHSMHKSTKTDSTKTTHKPVK